MPALFGITPEIHEVAEHLARAAHAAQWNGKANEPYIFHPERVAGYTQRAMVTLQKTDRISLDWGDSLEALWAAKAGGWLHDTVEDTWVTPQILRDTFRGIRDVTTRLIEPVLLVSRNYGGRTVDEYYRTIGENPRALVLKFADMMDNGDPIRIAQIVDEGTRIRLTHKYNDAARDMGIKEEFEGWKMHRMSLPKWDLLSNR